MTEIVAEISGNHGGSLTNACELITHARAAGADAVKFQCFEPERLAAKRGNISWQGNELIFDDLLALYRKTHTPKDWFPVLIEQAGAAGIPWFSSVFDPADVAFLETLGCPRYKISAYEMLDGDLINAVKATGKPIVMSVRPREGLTLMRATEYGWLEFGNYGASDHTSNGFPGYGGCPMIERHLRLPDVETPDTEFSSTPEEFKAYVAAIRRASL